MPFFKTPMKATPLHLGWADQLHKAIAISGNRVGQRWSRPAWAEQFRILDNQIQDRGLISRVLHWYVGNIGKPYVPEALAAKSFRMKFSNIKAAMERTQPIPKVLAISPAIAYHADTLSRLHWPKGICKTDLAMAMQASYDNLVKLRTKIKKYKVWCDQQIDGKVKATTLVGWTDVARANTAQRMLDHLMYAADVVRRHFESTYRRVHHWKDWSGDLKYFILTEQSIHMYHIGREWMWAYSANARLTWDKFMEEINGTR